MHSSNPEEVYVVAELLAKRAAVVRMLPPTSMKKQAMNQPETNWLTHLGLTTVKAAQNETPPPPAPVLKGGVPEPGFFGRMGKMSPWKTGLYGGLGGAALGGLAGLFTTSEEDEENKWRNALTGAMAGGALGGGLGMAAPAFGRLARGRQLDVAEAEAAGKLHKPGIISNVMDVAGRQALVPEVGLPLATTAAYHAHRAGFTPGFRGGLSSPEQVFSEAAAKPGPTRNYVESVTDKKFPTGGRGAGAIGYGRSGGQPTPGAPPTLKDFEDALKKGDPKDPARLVRRSAGGAPYLRKENRLLKLLMGGKDPYYVTGRPGSRLRGVGGTALALGLPFLATRLGRRALGSSEAQQQLEAIQQEKARISRRGLFE